MGFNTFPCNPYPISTEELNKGNNDDLNTRVAALESDVSDLNSTKANQITIAPFFNSETAYTAGDLVYYNGLSYRCTNDHEGEWDADDFAATTIANELDTLKSGLINVNSINNECSFDVNSIRATFNAQSKVVSFDVRSNDGFTASTWTPLLTITDASLAPSSTIYFPVTFINANRDDVVGHGVGKLETNNIISVCPDDTIPAYSEAVGIVMWQ